jgi:F420-dependent oxidoreductase-like protein
MQLRVMTEPQQGASYLDQLRVARTAEELGFDAFFRSDHYLAMGTDGLPGPTDAWVTLAGLARETTRIRLGTMVTSVTFRHPGPLAISVAQVDQMSGGRVELGIGAGWFAAEHQAYGIPFPDAPQRFDRLEETLDVITGLWKVPLGQTFEYDGKHISISDSPGLPKPVQQPGPPIIIGGKGKRRTPELAARHAAEFNLPFDSEDAAARQFARVRAACEQTGRAPASLVLSAALTLACGADDAEVARRAAATGSHVEELRSTGLVGTPDQVVEKLRRYDEMGVARVYLQVLDLQDLDHLALVADRVVPQL